jgi:hypothetical protein
MYLNQNCTDSNDHASIFSYFTQYMYTMHDISLCLNSVHASLTSLTSSCKFLIFFPRLIFKNNCSISPLNYYTLLYEILLDQIKKIRQEIHVARMIEITNTYRFLSHSYSESACIESLPGNLSRCCRGPRWLASTWFNVGGSNASYPCSFFRDILLGEARDNTWIIPWPRLPYPFRFILLFDSI